MWYSIVMPTTDDIRKIAAPILKKAGIRKAGLFGSAARGDVHAESDIDILIEPSKPFGLFDLVHVKNELEDAFQRKVDVIDYRSIKSRMRGSILEDEIAIL